MEVFSKYEGLRKEGAKIKKGMRFLQYQFWDLMAYIEAELGIGATVEYRYLYNKVRQRRVPVQESSQACTDGLHSKGNENVGIDAHVDAQVMGEEVVTFVKEDNKGVAVNKREVKQNEALPSKFSGEDNIV
ncbi:hypothetical protein V6N12_062388 [Hibiscus sabdariffa]|uniref:Uncharacterized protein n=1 Tax=Hibiscus sabdariffa TaxID=183260 RepID=A0ABR2F8P9_9ROSI